MRGDKKKTNSQLTVAKLIVLLTIAGFLGAVAAAAGNAPAAGGRRRGGRPGAYASIHSRSNGHQHQTDRRNLLISPTVL
jgi:hypothetical protein